MLIYVLVYTRLTCAFRCYWNNFLPGTVLVLYYFACMTCQAIHNYGPVPIVPVVETSRSRGRMSPAPWLIAGLTPFCCSYSVTLNVDGAHKESHWHWHWYGEHFLQSVQTITRVEPATYSVGAEGVFPLEASATGVWSCPSTTLHRSWRGA
jgi:hypothetical protein